MIIDCISDPHGHKPELEGGDLLIVAGDLTARDSKEEMLFFLEWIQGLNYRKIVFIAGNHDGWMQKNQKIWTLKTEDSDIIYLCDSGAEFEGLKIWGSPWTPTYGCWYFMKNRGDEIKSAWDLIPDDIDILVTHGPPYGILDKNIDGEHCGCEELREAAFRLSPKLHVFGHIHECGGKTLNTVLTQYVNASIMNEKYWPVNKPIRIIL